VEQKDIIKFSVNAAAEIAVTLKIRNEGNAYRPCSTNPALVSQQLL